VRASEVNEAQTMTYRPDIDGLRAIAVLAVHRGGDGVDGDVPLRFDAGLLTAKDRSKSAGGSRPPSST
jgi:hypothetical protein